MKPLRKPRGSRQRQGFILAFALIFTGISAFMLFMTLTESKLPEIVFVSLFVVIGLLLILFAVWRSIPKLKMSSPVLMISKTEIRVGDRFNLDYRQIFKAASDVTQANISLIFQEAATYNYGTDTRTDLHDIVVETHEIPGRHFEAGEVLQQSYSMVIPADAMHTFIAKNNELQWFLRLHVNIVDWPDLKEDYPINVLPLKAWDI
jgi:hypothetical protein